LSASISLRWNEYKDEINTSYKLPSFFTLARQPSTFGLRLSQFVAVCIFAAKSYNSCEVSVAQPNSYQTEVEIKQLRLDQLRTDGGTHCRTEINAFQVDEYVAAMRRGDTFPPVKARYDGTDYWLWDGYHTLAAAQEVGAKTISVKVRPGTHRDALLDAIGANADHDLPRTNADKRY